MKKSLPQLEIISKKLSSHQTYYSFNKMDTHLSSKYRSGRIKASKWMNELIYFFIEKESKLILEFKEQLDEQKKKSQDLKEGDFKQGLLDELNEIKKILDDNDRSS